MPDYYYCQVVGQTGNGISVEVQWEHKRGNGHEPLRLDSYFNYIDLWNTEPSNTPGLLQIFCLTKQ